eukprot:TRINITY_DN10083_c0_g2_i1.p1 TRINITY_DN10083_c0_g2~~TRINITY_DN10083_c0_g2_i1.p1  ORF type:complete len:972 (+),score=303.13 TRINITY_DN10083_c0_g2_i1:79-2916(+)
MRFGGSGDGCRGGGGGGHRAAGLGPAEGRSAAKQLRVLTPAPDTAPHGHPRRAARLPRLAAPSPDRMDLLSTMSFGKQFLSFFDTWPANSRASLAKESRPQLLLHMEDAVACGLSCLRKEFPSCADYNTLENPFAGDDDGLPAAEGDSAAVGERALALLTASQEDGSESSPQGSPRSRDARGMRPRLRAAVGEPGARQRSRSKTQPTSPRKMTPDMRRLVRARAEVFRRAALYFAASFRTYRPLLRWIIYEFDKLHACLEQEAAEDRTALEVSEKRRAQTEEALRASRKEVQELTAAHAEQVATLKKRMHRFETQDDSVLQELKENRERVQIAENALKEAEVNNAVLSKRVRKIEFHLKEAIEKATMNAEAVMLRFKCAELDEKYRTLLRIHQSTLGENAALKQGGGTAALDTAEIAEPGLQLTPRPNWESEHLRELVTYDGSTADAVDGLRDLVKAAEAQAHREPPQHEEAQALVAPSAAPADLLSTAATQDRKWMLPLGTGAAVPPALRFAGRVAAVRLTRQEVSGLLADFWRFRGQQQRAGQSIAGAVLDWAAQRAPAPAPASPTSRPPASPAGTEPPAVDFASAGDPPVPPAAAAEAYAFAAGLLRYGDDAQCWAAARILFGDMDETLWQQLEQCTTPYTAAVEKLTHGNTGRVTRERLMQLIDEVCTAKTQVQLQELHRAAEEDMLPPQVAERTGHRARASVAAVALSTSSVCAALRLQHLAERTALLSDYEDALLQRAGDSCAPLTAAEVAAAVLAADPPAPPDAVAAVVAAAFPPQPEPAPPPAAPPAEGSEAGTVGRMDSQESAARVEDRASVATIVARLRRTAPRRYARPPPVAPPSPPAAPVPTSSMRQRPGTVRGDGAEAAAGAAAPKMRNTPSVAPGQLRPAPQQAAPVTPRSAQRSSPAQGRAGPQRGQSPPPAASAPRSAGNRRVSAETPV